MDFSAIPPEINSSLIYAGPGPSALIEAGQAWQTLSADLEASAVQYRTVLAGVAAAWQGPSATAMTTAAQPYIAWMEQTAELAGQSAAQANAAVSAYTTAYAATIPPPVIAANRAQLLMLVATNLLGQNTPAIAANEAMYAGFWAQDATAMNAYAATSQTAAAGLPRFTQAPQTTSGSAVPTPLPNPFSGISTLLSNILSDPTFGLINTYAGNLLQSGVFQDVPLAFLALFNAITAEKTSELAAEGAAGLAAPVVVNAAGSPAPVEAPKPVAAASGIGNQIGRLSVPPSWAQPQSCREAPVSRPAAIPLSVRGQTAIPAVPFMPVTGLRSNQGKVRTDPEYGVVHKIVPPRHPAGG